MAANMQRWEVMDMEGITPNQLMDAVVVILAILSAVIVVDKAIDIVKKWRTPSTDTEKKLANDKVRLDKHEAAIKELKEGQQVLCAGVMAQLDHELHNGNAEQMQKARDDIMEYLQGQLTK